MATVPSSPSNVTINRPLLEVWGPVVINICLIVVAIWYVHTYLIPSVVPPSPVVDVRSEGKAYAIDTLKNYAKFWRAVPDDLDAGKKMADALKALHDNKQAADRADFEKRFGPVLAKILPEGSEPTADQKAKVRQFYAELAAGAEEVNGVK